MIFSKTSPVKIVLLGCGGTGGYIAPHLYRIAHTLKRETHIIIADGDLVEKKNLVRQNFAFCDIGENKAKVIAQRYSHAFGLEAEYIPGYIEDEEALKKLVQYGYYSAVSMPVILIGAVDNNRSRRMCHKVFHDSHKLIYIDSGNGEFTGQVVCGIRIDGKTVFPSIGDVYPDILSDEDKFPTELSCAERSISAPQSIAANLMASTAVVTMLYNLLVLGSIDVEKNTFSSRTLNMKSIIRIEEKKRDEGNLKSVC